MTEAAKTESIGDLLQARARKLDAVITVATEDERKSYAEDGVDFGPFILRCHDGYHVIWDATLPAEGIADALNCLEREYQLPDDQLGDAWRNFGKRWLP
jgi:hypothetical protein